MSQPSIIKFYFAFIFLSKKKNFSLNFFLSKLFLPANRFRIKERTNMLAIKSKNYLRPCLDRKRSNFCLKSFKTFLFQVETRFHVENAYVIYSQLPFNERSPYHDDSKRIFKRDNLLIQQPTK